MFDPRGETLGAEFYANVERASCEEAGLHVDPGTEAWWRDQSREAREALTREPMNVADASLEFCGWFRRTGGIFVWSQGANFDEPIIQAVFHAVGHRAPWKFWDTRDTRTIYEAGGLNTKTIKRAGTHHDALADARHQALCVQRAYARIKQP
jgi:hypothetical protein